jgi:hypothetical protein
MLSTVAQIVSLIKRRISCETKSAKRNLQKPAATALGAPAAGPRRIKKRALHRSKTLTIAPGSARK